MFLGYDQSPLLVDLLREGDGNAVVFGAHLVPYYVLAPVIRLLDGIIEKTQRLVKSEVPSSFTGNGGV